METEEKFWIPARIRAVLWTLLLGTLGGPVGYLLANPAPLSASTVLGGVRLGGIMGGAVAVFAFIFPKAEDDPPKLGLWGVASLILGLGIGAVAGLLRKQGLIH